MRVAAVIPARMAATRFPGKPLISILGLPMIEHVRRRTEQIKEIDEVWVATCDEEIRKTVESFGGKVIMTSDKHERATDRIEEASYKINADIFINVQGDEPMVTKEHLIPLIEPFRKNIELKCSCLCYPIKDYSDLENLNIVKAVLSLSGKILYLSRSKIPGKDVDANTKYYKQSGLMAYSKKSLQEFSRLKSTPLEKKESVDLLRFLENDMPLQGIIHDIETHGIDSPDQVAAVEERILKDQIQRKIYESIR